MNLRTRRRRLVCFAVAAALLAPLPVSSLFAGDWPMYGHDPSRNMVSTETGLPETFDPGKPNDAGDVDPASGKNLKWAAKLGDAYYGNATVAGGKVFVGINNTNPRNPARTGDYGVLLCLDEASGKMLWQLTVPKLAAGKSSDFENVGLCSSPTVDGDRVYAVTNRCEVICLTTSGLAKGNEGPFKDEAKYVGAEVGPTDADIVWKYDMRDELGVIPRFATSSSVLVVGDKLFVTTSNGVDWTNKHVPSPNAPALICLDKKTGKLLGEEKSGISARTFRSNWSSPAYGKAGDTDVVVFGGGDGYCYGFDPNPQDGVLKELWRCDCNPANRRTDVQGRPAKYGAERGPNEVIATPTIVGGKVYVTIGQDPDAGEGEGGLTCIDATKTGDITETGKVWQFDGIGRSMSTPAVSADGLLYVADLGGVIRCFSADKGEVLWTHDTEGKTWGSTLLADGKIYLGNEGGVMTILAAGKEKKVIGTVAFDGAINSSAVAANGVLYVGTDKMLFAFQKK